MAEENDLSKLFGSTPDPIGVSQDTSVEKVSKSKDLGDLFGNNPDPIAQQEKATTEQKPTKQYKPATASDVAKSLGSGAEVGLGEMAGFPGDVAAGLRYVGEGGKYYVQKGLESQGYLPKGTADENWKAVEASREAPQRKYVGILPTSDVTVPYVKEHLPGANYEPESQLGAVAHSVGEFVPAAFGGEGSLAKRLGTAAIAGAGSEVAGQATAGTEAEPYARIGAALLSPFAAEKTLSRPLGTLGSKLGVSDEALASVGLKSDSMAAKNELIQNILKAKQTGDYSGLSSDELQFIRDREIATGGPNAESQITSALAAGGTPADVLKLINKRADLSSTDFDQAKADLYNGYRQMSANADQITSGMLKEAENEAMLSGLNNWLLKNNKDIIDEAPKSAAEAMKLAKSVREDLYKTTYTPIFENFPSVTSDRLENTLQSKPVQKAFLDTLDEINSLRDRYQEPPLPKFWTQMDNGKFAIGANTPDGRIAGAPLEFWDRLANQLYTQGTNASRNYSASIKAGLDDYFKSKNIINPLTEARKKVGDIRTGSDALSEGMNFIHSLVYETNPVKREAALSTFENLGDVEKSLYQAGAMRQARTILAQGDKGVNDWNNALSNSDNRALTQSVFNFKPEGAPAKAGPSNYDTLQRALEISGQFNKEKIGQVVSGTKTSRSFLDRLTAPTGVNNKSVFGILLSSAERAYLFGTPYGLITIANGGVGYVRQVLADRRARQMFNILINKDPKQAIALAKEIESSKADKTSWQKIRSLLDFSNKATINFYRRAAIASNQQGQKNGGRITDADRPKRATGGRIPEADKMFKAAKKVLDGQTQSMLHVPDDTIVHALKIAQGRV